MTDQEWLLGFEDVSAAIQGATAGLAGTDAARVEHSIGAGGDTTVEIDRRAEDAAFVVFESWAARGERFAVLSEEVGLREFGARYPVVFLDPIDGSLNAKNGLPIYAVMLTLLDGPLVGDARVGHVLNLATGESWDAIRGHGARRRGAPLKPHPSGGSIEVLGLESTPRNILDAAPLLARTGKVRLFGSMALSLAHTAAGGISVHCSTIRARVFDMTASALMITEVGGVVSDLDGTPLAGVEAGLESRRTLLSSADPALHALALKLLRPPA